MTMVLNTTKRGLPKPTDLAYCNTGLRFDQPYSGSCWRAGFANRHRHQDSISAFYTGSAKAVLQIARLPKALLMLGNLSQDAKQTLAQRFQASFFVTQSGSAIAAALFWRVRRALFRCIGGDLVLILGAWVAAAVYELTNSVYKVTNSVYKIAKSTYKTAN